MQSISINPCSFTATAEWVKEYFATANLRRLNKGFYSLEPA